jgi:hypothetical protein
MKTVIHDLDDLGIETNWFRIPQDVGFQMICDLTTTLLSKG